MLAALCLSSFATSIHGSSLQGSTEPVDPPPITRPLSVDTKSAASLPYEPTFVGGVHMWLESEQSDPFLRVEDDEGVLITEDDDSGGGKTAFVRFDVDGRSKYRVFTTIAKGAQPSDATLAIRIAPETDATRAAAEALLAASVEAKKLAQNGEYEFARATLVDALDQTLAVEGAARSRDVNRAVGQIGFDLYSLGAIPAAQKAFRFSLAFRERCFPPDREEVQFARINLATSIKESGGDLHEVRELEEKALASFCRIRPPDHLDITKAEQGLPNILDALGETEAAFALTKKVYETRLRTLPADDLELMFARNNYARLLDDRGEPEEAVRLFQQSLSVAEQLPPQRDEELQFVRNNLARVEQILGHFESARGLAEQAVASLSRTMPATHHTRLESEWRLSSILAETGDLRAAREIQERALEACISALPDDHRLVQRARVWLAITLYRMGDLAGARTLFEKVLEVYERSLPDDHILLQQARGNVASVLDEFGEDEAALRLRQKTYDVMSASLPPGSPDLAKSRQGLAGTLSNLGRLAEARELEETALETISKILPADDRTVCDLRINLAVSLERAGELPRARELLQQVLSVRERLLPPDHVDLILPNGNNVQVLAQMDDRAALVDAARRLCSSLQRQASLLALTTSPREAEMVSSTRFEYPLSRLLSITGGASKTGALHELEPEVFATMESLRGLPLVVGRISRRVAQAGEGDLSRLRTELRDATNKITRVALDQRRKDELGDAVRRRDRIERELCEKSTGDLRVPQIDVAAVAHALQSDEAAVIYREYARWPLPQHYPVVHETTERSLLAFVVRPDGELRRFELGPAEAIEALVEHWRASIRTPIERGTKAELDGIVEKVAKSGSELRGVVLDPLLTALNGIGRLVIVPDGTLHLIAFDALPLGDGCVGARFQITERSTLWELLLRATPPASEPSFAGFGDIDYDAGPQGERDEAKLLGTESVAKVPGADDAAKHSDAESVAKGSGAGGVAKASGTESVAKVSGAEGATKGSGAKSVANQQKAAVASSTRASTWERTFTPLPSTGSETDAIAKLFTKTFGETASARVLKDRQASKSALIDLAPKSRWLHVATHGYFSPESVGAIDGARPGALPGSSQLEQVQGLSPLVLCGLALTGANLAPDANGDFPGIVTGEELAALDLSRCELAVLSACDTHEGEKHVGQGVASLQRALFTAGVQTTITSLWKVPDEAARELMTDFYRRLWVRRSRRASRCGKRRCAFGTRRTRMGVRCTRRATGPAGSCRANPSKSAPHSFQYGPRSGTRVSRGIASVR